MAKAQDKANTKATPEEPQKAGAVQPTPPPQTKNKPPEELPQGLKKFDKFKKGSI